MNYPKVTKVQYKRTIVPNASCGTGYDEPSIYSLTLDNGEVVEKTLYDWYRPYSETSKQIKDICYSMPILNPSDAFTMFLECWKEHLGIK